MSNEVPVVCLDVLRRPDVTLNNGTLHLHHAKFGVTIQFYVTFDVTYLRYDTLRYNQRLPSLNSDVAPEIIRCEGPYCTIYKKKKKKMYPLRNLSSRVNEVMNKIAKEVTVILTH